MRLSKTLQTLSYQTLSILWNGVNVSYRPVVAEDCPLKRNGIYSGIFYLTVWRAEKRGHPSNRNPIRFVLVAERGQRTVE